MISFSQFLTEARMAPLYHGTPTYNIVKILKEDKIKRGFDDKRHPAKDGRIVSLTRNYTFARRWKGGSIVLELDQQKLTQNFKITPFNFFGLPDPWEAYGGGSDEPLRARWIPGGGRFEPKRDYEFKNQYEESVHKDIAPLSKYLVKIIVDTRTLYEVNNNDDLKIVLNHPLLYNIDEKKWVNK